MTMTRTCLGCTHCRRTSTRKGVVTLCALRGLAIAPMRPCGEFLSQYDRPGKVKMIEARLSSAHRAGTLSPTQTARSLEAPAWLL